MNRCTCPADRVDICDRCTNRIEDLELYLEYAPCLDQEADAGADRYEQALWNALEGL